LSHWLVEFQHGKWDEIEVPGQYLEVFYTYYEFRAVFSSSTAQG
jgi:hypothetical protein